MLHVYKTQNSGRVYCPQGHLMQYRGISKASWRCDRGQLGHSQRFQSTGVQRYQCEECDFDYCDACHKALASMLICAAVNVFCILCLLRCVCKQNVISSSVLRLVQMCLMHSCSIKEIHVHNMMIDKLVMYVFCMTVSAVYMHVCLNVFTHAW